MSKWTEEDLTILETMYTKGDSALAIAEILNRSEGAIKSQAWLRGFKRPGRSGCRSWQAWEIQLLDQRKREGKPLQEIAEELGRTLNSIKAQSSKMLKESGMGRSGNKKNLYKNKDLSQPAKVYLVYFPAEGFYKVGVTIQDIHIRLQGFPKYEIVQILETSLGEALELEAGVIEIYKRGAVSTGNTRLLKHGGLSECFYSEETPLIL